MTLNRDVDAVHIDFINYVLEAVVFEINGNLSSVYPGPEWSGHFRGAGPNETPVAYSVYGIDHNGRHHWIADFSTIETAAAYLASLLAQLDNFLGAQSPQGWQFAA